MSGFKETGDYNPITVPQDVRGGGLCLRKGYAVKHPVFRLRKIGEEESATGVSNQDLSPLNLHPGDIGEVRLPECEEEINVGDEREFTAIDANDGRPVDLYNGDKVYRKNGTIGFISNNGHEPWMIDTLGGDPECLRFQIEIGARPENHLPSFDRGITLKTDALINECEKHGILLLPTGLTGENLSSNWSNVSPHPYIGAIHLHGLKETALDFDAQTIQTHIDLAPFGVDGKTPVEFALHVGNVYNTLLASMISGISTAAPFYKGKITGNYSNREIARNGLYTVGGVQGNIPVNWQNFFDHGDKLIRSGEIPVPERAGSHLARRGNGSHKDYRPKVSLGTGEFGSADMNPNDQLHSACRTVLRSFVWKIAHDLKNGNPLPSFMQSTSENVRVQNRSEVSRRGNNAILKTSRGQMHISDAWDHMFDWLGYKQVGVPRSKAMAHATIMKALNISVVEGAGIKAVENYFDRRNSQTYKVGNFAEVMLEYARSYQNETGANDIDTIRATNLEIARRYHVDVHNNAYQLGQGIAL